MTSDKEPALPNASSEEHGKSYGVENLEAQILHYVLQYGVNTQSGNFLCLMAGGRNRGMGNLVGNGQLPVTGEDNHVTHQRPLWVKSRRFATTLKMSAFGGKADVFHYRPICPLIAISGHVLDLLAKSIFAVWLAIQAQPKRSQPPTPVAMRRRG